MGYVHGIVGCPSDMDCESGAIDHTVPCDPEMLDHAVLIVGYGTQENSAYDLALSESSDDDGDDDPDQEYIPYWVIKNSWERPGVRRVTTASCAATTTAVLPTL